jgi:hypothetical protein
MNREYIEKLHAILADEDGNLPFIEHFDGEVRATFSDGSVAELRFFNNQWHFDRDMSESAWA